MKNATKRVHRHRRRSISRKQRRRHQRPRRHTQKGGEPTVFTENDIGNMYRLIINKVSEEGNPSVHEEIAMKCVYVADHEVFFTIQSLVTKTQYEHLVNGFINDLTYSSYEKFDHSGLIRMHNAFDMTHENEAMNDYTFRLQPITNGHVLSLSERHRKEIEQAINPHLPEDMQREILKY